MDAVIAPTLGVQGKATQAAVDSKPGVVSMEITMDRSQAVAGSTVTVGLEISTDGGNSWDLLCAQKRITGETWFKDDHVTIDPDFHFTMRYSANSPFPANGKVRVFIISEGSSFSSSGGTLKQQ